MVSPEGTTRQPVCAVDFDQTITRGPECIEDPYVKRRFAQLLHRSYSIVRFREVLLPSYFIEKVRQLLPQTGAEHQSALNKTLNELTLAKITGDEDQAWILFKTLHKQIHTLNKSFFKGLKKIGIKNPFEHFTPLLPSSIFAGMTESQLLALENEDFPSPQKNDAVIELIKQERANHLIVVVSGSHEAILRRSIERMGLRELIDHAHGSIYEMRDGRYTGRIKTPMVFDNKLFTARTHGWIQTTIADTEGENNEIHDAALEVDHRVHQTGQIETITVNPPRALVP